MKIADLFVKLGVVSDVRKVEQFQRALKGVRQNLIVIQATAVASAVAIERFANGTINSAVNLQNLNNQTGLSTKKLQEWQRAAQLSDISLSADQVSQSIAGLDKRLTSIRLGQGNIAPFQLLGIDIKGDAFDVLEQLRSRIKNLNPGVATNLISQIGLNPEFINVLRTSREEFEQLSKRTLLGKNQIAAVVAAGTAITRLKLRLMALKDQAVARLAPGLERIANHFFEYLQRNGEKIISAITTIARIFGRFAIAVGNAVDIVARFIDRITGTEQGFKALAIAGALLVASFSPVIAILLGVIAILDDIAVWKRGGKSLFGGLFDAIAEFSEKIGGFPTIATILGGTAALAFIGKLSSALTGINGTLATIGTKGKALGLIGGVIGAVTLNEIGKKGGTSASNVLGKSAGGALIGAQLGSFIPGVGTAIGTGIGGAGGFAVGAFQEREETKKGIQQMINRENEILLENLQKGTAEQNINITINTGGGDVGDPIAIANELRRALREANPSFARGF